MRERETNQARPMRGPGGMGHMMRGGEKAKDFRSAMQKLIAYCKRSRVVVMAAVLLAVVGAVLNVLGPSYLRKITNLITDGIMTGIDLTAVVRIAVLLVVMYGLGYIFNAVQGILMSDMSQLTVKRFRTDISTKINRLPLRYFDAHTVGDTMSRVTNDVDTIGQSLTQSLSTSVSAICMFFGSLIMMFVTNWIMALAGVAATMIGFSLMLIIIKRSQKYFTAQQAELGTINGHIEEYYAGHTVVKAYNGVGEAKKTFGGMNERLYRSAWKSQFMSGLMMPLMNFIGNLGYVVVCIAGALLVLNGKTDFGVIVAFMMYIRLFTQPLSQIAQVTTSLQSAAAASERVFDFLEEPEMESETGKTQMPDNVRGDVAFQNVRFGYDPNREIIHDFSASAKAGQKIAIVGPTGAGKTTLVNLLMRFYEVQGGTISIDGVSTEAITRANVHRLFGMVLQDTWLFEGTIRENIVYGKQDVTEEELIKVTKAAGLYHFIRTLPKGFDTVLNDNARLSAGQKQLVTIARAMIEDAPLLILDEATSSVDTRTEELIQRAMDELTVGRTSFVIAHRLSTIRNADLILVMRDGDIVESGNHETLMAKRGFYADLYNSQFESA